MNEGILDEMTTEESAPPQPAVTQPTHMTAGASTATTKDAVEALVDNPLTRELIEGVRSGTQVIAHDGFDVLNFRHAEAQYTKLAATVAETRETLATAPALALDLFNSFMKRAPEVSPPVPLLPSHEVNRELVEQITSTVEWREMREMGTVGDPVMSALATIRTLHETIAALPDDARRRINALADLETRLRRLYDEAVAVEEAAALESSASRTPAEMRRLRDRARRLRQKGDFVLREALAEAEQLAPERDRIADAVRRRARAGLAETQQEIEQTAQALKAFSGGYDGGLSSGGMCGSGVGGAGTATGAKIELAERVRASDKLRRIAEMCGRLTRIAVALQKKKVSHPPDEISSITTGDSIAHTLASDLALLADPDTEDLFYLKQAERRLTQYELIHNEPQGRGPIMCAVDESGSMAGESDVWAKGVVLALLAVARLQRRDMVVLHFASDDQLTIEHFEKGQAGPVETLECADHFFNGGTSFEPFMREMVRIADTHRYKQADAIIVTDGCASVGEQALAEWKHARAEREMRAYGVLIGAEGSGGARQLAELCDAVMTAHDLTNDAPVLERIFSI